MTGTQLAALIHQKTRTNSTTFTLADMLVDVNIFKDELAAMIAAEKQEAFNVFEYDDLVADQRLYPYKTTLMNQLVRIEIKFSSTVDYVLAVPCQLSQTKIAMQESVIVTYYDNLDPQYFIRGKHIYILSAAISDYTDGLKWVYKIFPSDLANLTGIVELSTDTSATALGFPREFHELWARRVSIEYKDRNNIRLSSREQKYEIDLRDAIDRFNVPNIDEQYKGKLPSSAHTGDDGFDY